MTSVEVVIHLSRRCRSAVDSASSLVGGVGSQCPAVGVHGEVTA